MKKRRNKFINLPEILGGREALKKYFEANLIYPEEAREKRIEGIVELNAEIDDNGKVIQVEIIKGLTGGCNEEAERLIRNVQFGAVKNKGLRVKTKKRFKIKFQLPPETKINYTVVCKKEDSSSPDTTRKYNYTVNIQ